MAAHTCGRTYKKKGLGRRQKNEEGEGKNWTRVTFKGLKISTSKGTTR